MIEHLDASTFGFDESNHIKLVLFFRVTNTQCPPGACMDVC